MRRFLTIVALLSIVGSLQAQDTLKVLFLGNSYTFYNDMPGMFQNLSASGGKAVLTDMSAPGGSLLEYHCENTTSLDKISQGIWDYVVLQEQSQVPTIDYYRYNSMYPSARFLDSLITEQGQQTCFFMTWGREHGGQQSANGYSSPVFEDFFHMQDSVNSAYMQITEELSAELAEVGNAWATAVTNDPDLDLWTADNSHPTLKGSYLAACVFYATFFEESPIGLSYFAGLNSEDAYFLQSMADQTVLEVSDVTPPAPYTADIVTVYPNPFNPTTTITFDLAVASQVQLDVFDINGRNCMTESITTPTMGFYNAGKHEISFNAGNLPSGLYIYRLTTGEFIGVGKLVLMK